MIDLSQVSRSFTVGDQVPIMGLPEYSLLTLISLLAVSYLLGCINAAYYFARWLHGHDIRAYGSGNAGARNAGRIYGAGAFIMVLLFDAGKGISAVFLGYLAYPVLAPVCGLAAVAGHIWPFQLRGRGGKGMATALGMVSAINPWLLVLPIILGGFLLAARLSLARSGILAFWCILPVAIFISTPVTVVVMGLLAIILTVTHRANLQSGAR